MGDLVATASLFAWLSLTVCSSLLYFYAWVGGLVAVGFSMAPFSISPFFPAGVIVDTSYDAE